MGKITSALKGEAMSALNQVKSINVENEINSKLSAAGVNFQLPKLEVPEGMKNMKLDVDTSSLKLPAGVDNYISPVAQKIFSGVKLPSEINGVQLPQMPDLSSVSAQVDDLLSGLGFDTSKLGIRSVSDILKEPDLSALKNVSFESPVDLNNMPDITSSLDDFDINSLQTDIDDLTSQIPGMEKIDISKYF